LFSAEPEISLTPQIRGWAGGREVERVEGEVG